MRMRLQARCALKVSFNYYYYYIRQSSAVTHRWLRGRLGQWRTRWLQQHGRCLWAMGVQARGVPVAPSEAALSPCPFVIGEVGAGYRCGRWLERGQVGVSGGKVTVVSHIIHLKRLTPQDIAQHHLFID